MSAKHCLTALLLACTTAAGAQDAGHAFHRWLEAHNDGTRARLEAFNRQYHVTADVQADLDFRESMGRFRLLETRSETPVKIEAVIQSEWDNTLLATIEVDPAHPFTLATMQFEGMPTPAGFEPARMARDAVAAESKRLLDEMATAGKVSGVFVIATEGRPVFAWSGGFADREAATPVTPGTRFRMASLGKMITAVAILQLAETGRLSLDDRVSRHLPEYPDRATAGAITVRQLLNHTSGTGDVFGDDFAKVAASLRTHSDYWRVYASAPLEFAPGTQDRYSNYGYVLLGSVIEAASGTSYYRYVEQHVLRPAGMRDTGFEPESAQVARRAHAYTKVDGEWRREKASLPWRGTAAGGGYTTAGDLVKFADALIDGKLLSPTSLDAATRPQNHKAWYGYGFMVAGEGKERQFGHEGGAAGSNAAMVVLPAGRHVVVGLANVDPSAMANVVNFASRRLPLD